MVHLRATGFVLAALTVLACLDVQPVQAEVKFGVDQVQLSGPSYTHDNGVTKLKNSTGMVATQVTIEYLTKQYFGFEVAYSVTPLSRSYQLASGATSSNVNERASYTTVGVNLYPYPEDRKGLKPVIGFATGTVNVSQDFVGGTLGSASTNQSVDINIMKFGFDWVGDRIGFRLQYQAWAGSVSNSTKLAGIRQTNSYDGSAVSLGAFTMF